MTLLRAHIGVHSSRGLGGRSMHKIYVGRSTESVNSWAVAPSTELMDSWAAVPSTESVDFFLS